MYNGTYLIQVVDTSLAVVVVAKYLWLFLLSIAHRRLPVFGADEQHILSAFWHIGDSSMGPSESKHGGEDSSPLHFQELRSKLWFVSLDGTDQSHLLLQQLFCQGKG